MLNEHRLERPRDPRSTSGARRLANPEALEQAEQSFMESVDLVVIPDALTSGDIEPPTKETEESRLKRKRSDQDTAVEDAERPSKLSCEKCDLNFRTPGLLR